MEIREAVEMVRNDPKGALLYFMGLDLMNDPAQAAAVGIIFHNESAFDEASAICVELFRRQGWMHPFIDPVGEVVPSRSYSPKSIQEMSLYDAYYRIRSEECGGINVFYTRDLCGRGSHFGQDLIRSVREKIGPVRHALEWCSGPAYIGFGILGTGLCKRLSLIDINPKAIRASTYTARKGDLTDRVAFVNSGDIDDLPQDDVYDVVVANPPMAPEIKDGYRYGFHERLTYDMGLRYHADFYKKIAKRLGRESLLIIQEASPLTSPEMFAGMIGEAGLEMIDIETNRLAANIYHVISKLK